VKSAITHNRTVAVPPVSGPKPVGTRVLRLVDSSRTDPFTANGRPRELLVRFWYPTTRLQTCQLAAYASPLVWSSYSQLAGLPLPDVSTNSCQDAPVASGDHQVVIFTPGYTATFTDYTFLLEDLASRGYIVASVNHTYEATAVEFPDGRLVRSVVGSHLNNTYRLDEQTLSLALATRQADLESVINELERMNATSGGSFSGKLDLSRIGLMGHSLGGESTLAGLRTDQRFKVGVLLEGSIADESVRPPARPS
jgi:predicted dienelactone hydrolase